MQLEDQVISLEYAKRLKELGVNQDSFFYFLNIDGEGKYYIYNIEHFPEDSEHDGEPISAFTGAELSEILPACIDTKKNEPFNYFWIDIKKRTPKNIQYIINYYCDTHEIDNSIFSRRRLNIHSIYDNNLADAMSKMLIHLIENKLMEI